MTAPTIISSGTTASPDPVIAASAPGASPALPAREVAILLVEDNPVDAALVRGVLQKGPLHCELTHADSGQTALDRLRGAAFDLMLVDLQLPDLSGIETVSRFRGQAPDIPLVVLTGNDDEELGVQAVQMGAQDYLIKGQIDGSNLIRCIRYALERQRFNQQLGEKARHLAEANSRLQETNTRLEDALAQLEDAQEQLVQQERLRAISELASGIAHDLNNTLAPVVAYSEVSLCDQQLAGEQRSRLETIAKAAQDAAAIVSALRDAYCKPEDAQLNEHVRVDELARQVMELTRPRWRDEVQRHGRNIDFRLELQGVPPVKGRTSELRDLLTNLIFNAVDAMPAGGAITLRLSAESGFCLIEVADTGVGMNAEEHRRCLEPFYTTKQNTRSGLGLSICHGVVRRHGGRLEFDSTPGRGTTARVFLPAVVDHDKNGRSSKVEGPHVVEPPALRILHIDDDARVRGATALLLRKLGQHVDSAASGAEGLRMFRHGRYDLVLTDLGMPDVDGRQVVRRVRASRPDVPIVMMTGWGASKTGDLTDRERPDYLLDKPVRLAELREILRTVTERTSLNRQARRRQSISQ